MTKGVFKLGVRELPLAEVPGNSSGVAEAESSGWYLILIAFLVLLSRLLSLTTFCTF